nr:MAG TPA: TRAF PROTEIN, TRAO PROTEIN, TRAN ADHESION, BACTERIAL SECRETION.5A [Bacteriophage sp.]
MKKLVSVLLVCLLAICVSAPVCADGEAAAIDLEAMSLDELLELHEAIDAEIDARIGCEQETVCDGVYVAGTSIKPGTYIITCTSVNNMCMYVSTFASEDDYATYKANMFAPNAPRLTQVSLTEAGQSAMVYLGEGMVMEIVGGSGTINAAAAEWTM